MMKVFEVLLNGFDGGTDSTDNLVKWIAAEKKEHVRKIFNSISKCNQDEKSPWHSFEILDTDMNINDGGIDLVINPEFFNVSELS